ncbi:DUF4129 domain-containing protein [Amphibacillus sp. Q70]|uniref:DUF4129 domain-containing protein n=1 Tax=Amphibacillus sp. Q70 TaxID=3453416 RepID=UPI003F873984
MKQANAWRGVLEEILSTDEFQAYYQDQRNIFQRIWDWLKEWVTNLFQEWFSGLSPSSSIGDAILVILLTIGLILVCLLVAFALINWQRRKRLKDNQPLKNFSSQTLTFKDYQERFEEAEEREHYPEAIRYRFLLLLFNLEEKQLIKIERWKTNWDYFKELTQINEDQAERFYQLAVYFEAVTYGNKKVKSDDYHNYLTRVHAFEQEE